MLCDIYAKQSDHKGGSSYPSCHWLLYICSPQKPANHLVKEKKSYWALSPLFTFQGKWLQGNNTTTSRYFLQGFVIWMKVLQWHPFFRSWILKVCRSLRLNFIISNRKCMYFFIFNRGFLFGTWLWWGIPSTNKTNLDNYNFIRTTFLAFWGVNLH